MNEAFFKKVKALFDDSEESKAEVPKLPDRCTLELNIYGFVIEYDAYHDGLDDFLKEDTYLIYRKTGLHLEKIESFEKKPYFISSLRLDNFVPTALLKGSTKHGVEAFSAAASREMCRQETEEEETDNLIERCRSLINREKYDLALTLLGSEELKDLGPAINMLGYLHHQGFGVPKDIGLAVSHYEKAAYLGDVNGLSNLGNAYLSGEV